MTPIAFLGLGVILFLFGAAVGAGAMALFAAAGYDDREREDEARCLAEGWCR